MRTNSNLTKSKNNLAKLRKKRGLSVTELAVASSVTPSSLRDMEAGVYIPGTGIALRLARALAVEVEEIYTLDQMLEEASVSAAEVELLPGEAACHSAQPIRLCRVDRRLIAVPTGDDSAKIFTADGYVTRSAGGDSKTTVDLVRENVAFDTRLLVAGTIPGIPVFAHHLRKNGVDLVHTNASGVQALKLLKEGMVHVACVPLSKDGADAITLRSLKNYFRSRKIAVVSFACWESGLAVARGNPKRIYKVVDLVRPDVRIAAPRSAVGCEPHNVRCCSEMNSSLQYSWLDDEAYDDPFGAACQVQKGEADCCLAAKSTASLCDLNFIPLLNERYAFVVYRRHLELHQGRAFLATLGRTDFRRTLAVIERCDVSMAGVEIPVL